MPRIRTIKPEAPQHRKVGRLSDRAFRLWTTMLTQADDDGRLSADPGQLRLLAFGYFPDVSEADVAGALSEITIMGLVRTYVVDGTPWAHFPSWRDHQRISHPAPSKIPAPPPLVNPREDSGNLQKSPRGSEGLEGRKGFDGAPEAGGGPPPSQPEGLAAAHEEEHTEEEITIHSATEACARVKALLNGTVSKMPGVPK